MSAPDGWRAWRAALADRISQPALADPAVRTKAQLVLIDDLAAMIAASGAGEPAALAARLARPDAAGEATVFAGGRAARERAAAANAVAAAWDELDEGYRPATCHGGLYTVPAALAEAEATGRSLDDLLEAVVVGYEVVTAVARVFPSPRPLVLHPHATLSPLGAAATVAWLRTRNPQTVLACVDVASSLSLAGSFRHATQGLQDRNLWAGAGVQAGFLAVDAASAGLLADADSMLDVFRDTYGQAVDDRELAAGGDPGRWAILDGYHKLYACCQYTHSALEAAAELAGAVRQRGAGPGDIRDVVVHTHPLALALDERQPTTTLGGKFSVPHVVASVLVRDATDRAVFGAANLTDELVAAVRDRVRLEPYAPLPAAPHDRPALVTVRLQDGGELSAHCLSAIGGPDRPLGPDAVLAKAAELTVERAPGFDRQARAMLAGQISGDEPWEEVLARLVGR